MKSSPKTSRRGKFQVPTLCYGVAAESTRQPAGGAVRERHDAQPAEPAGDRGPRHQAVQRAVHSC